MEIFIATSIKSFDLNPTHPGPLPRVSFHTSATQHATDEVGDELQKSASSEQAIRCKGREWLQVSVRRKLRPLSLNGLAMISSSRLAATPRQLGSSAPRKAKSVSTAKVLRERIKRNDDERLPPLLDCRKWKTTERPRKTLRQPETTTGPRNTRSQKETSPGPPRTRDR